MKTLPFLAATFAAVAVTASAARDAHACWDGYAASVDRVDLRVPGDATWRPEKAREVARWATRMNALLPQGTKLESDLGFVTICTVNAAGECVTTVAETRWDNGSLAPLFKQVAQATQAAPAAVRSALRLDAAPVTLQVFASRSQAGADTVARRINDAHAGSDGFYTAGGFPADNPTAHVVAGTGKKGERVYRVLVGAFLAKGEAQTAAAELHRETGFQGFVRPL